MKVRRVILFVGVLLVVVGIFVFLNSGLRELPPIFFWGLLLLLFRFFLSRRGLGWKIAAFVVGWFELATMIGAFIRVVFWSSQVSSHHPSHHWAVVWWAQLIISAVVSGEAVYYLPLSLIHI